MQTLYAVFFSNPLALFAGVFFLMALIILGLFVMLARRAVRTNPGEPLPSSSGSSSRGLDIHPTTGQVMNAPGIDVSGNTL